MKTMFGCSLAAVMGSILMLGLCTQGLSVTGPGYSNANPRLELPTISNWRSFHRHRRIHLSLNRHQQWIFEDGEVVRGELGNSLARRAATVEARGNLRRWLSDRGEDSLAAVYREWESLLGSLTVAQVTELLVAEDERSTRLRQSSPFAGGGRRAKSGRSNAGAAMQRHELQHLIRAVRVLLIWLGVVFVAGCDSGTKWRSGKYEVYWIDGSNDLTLGYDVGEGGRIGRVMAQVFAVGEDDTWIVTARYPDGDRTKEEYFYFSKEKDDKFKNSEEVVRGPLTKSEFGKLKSDLGLPELSKWF